MQILPDEDMKEHIIAQQPHAPSMHRINYMKSNTLDMGISDNIMTNSLLIFMLNITGYNE